MNKARRKEINAIISKLYSFQNNIHTNKLANKDIGHTLDTLYIDVESVYWDEEDYMYNIPENMQSGTRYTIAEEACDNLIDAMDSISEAKNSGFDKEEIVNCIDSAINSLAQAAM